MKLAYLAVLGIASGARLLAQSSAEPVTDTRDGHVYKTVKIGTQVWMAENLAYLPAVSTAQFGSTSAKYFYVVGYNGTDTAVARGKETYARWGVLYNWSAAFDACPVGWRLPGELDWDILANYLAEHSFGAGESRADIAKSLASASGWEDHFSVGAVGYDQASNNRSGFSARPAGRLSMNRGFTNQGLYAEFWSADTIVVTIIRGGTRETRSDLARFRSLGYGYSELRKQSSDIRAPSQGVSKELGFSVRCVQNN
jgi:uncharacterized protein (TIGR02145 family)